MWADGIPEGGWNADARMSDFSLQRIILRSKQLKALRFELQRDRFVRNGGFEFFRGNKPPGNS